MIEFEDRTRFLSVPTMEKYKELGHRIYRTGKDGIAFFYLSLEDFERLYNSELLWEWDGKYSLILDDYEEGVIDRDLSENLSLVEERLGESPVKDAFELASRLGTAVYFYL